MKKRKLALICVSLMLTILTIVGCGSSDNNNTTTDKSDSNKYVIGALGTHPPYNFKEGDELQGYEVDIWNEIAKRKNIEIEYITATFDGLWGMLKEGKIDTILSQITVTEEREKEYDFTSTYMYNPGAWLVQKDAEEINDIKDLYGKKVGILPGSVDIKMYEDAAPNGEIEMVSFQEYPAAIKAVEDGKIDAVGTAIPQGKWRIKENPELNLKVSGNNGIVQTNAFPLVKNRDDDFKKLASEAIDEMKEDGTLKELSIKWFGIDTTVEDQ